LHWLRLEPATVMSRHQGAHLTLRAKAIAFSRPIPAKFPPRGKPDFTRIRRRISAHNRVREKPRSILLGLLVSFRPFVFIVLTHDRRRVVRFNVTAHPTAEWTAQQNARSLSFDTAPQYLLRDRDRIYGQEFRNQVAVMNIKEVLSAPRSPWQASLRR